MHLLVLHNQMFSENQLKKILIGTDLLKEEEYEKIAAEASSLGKKLEGYLIEKKVISPLILYENAANFYKIPYIDLKNQSIRKDVLFIVPEPVATTHGIIAFDADNKDIKLAVTDPENILIW